MHAMMADLSGECGSLRCAPSSFMQILRAEESCIEICHEAGVVSPLLFRQKDDHCSDAANEMDCERQDK